LNQSPVQGLEPEGSRK